MLKVAILNAEFGFEERIRTVIAREVLVSPDGGGMVDCHDFKSIVQLDFLLVNVDWGKNFNPCP